MRLSMVTKEALTIKLTRPLQHAMEEKVLKHINTYARAVLEAHQPKNKGEVLRVLGDAYQSAYLMTGDIDVGGNACLNFSHARIGVLKYGVTTRMPLGARLVNLAIGRERLNLTDTHAVLDSSKLRNAERLKKLTEEKCNTLIKEFNEAYDAVKATVHACRTVKQLVDLLPEAEKYIEKKGNTAMIPVETIKKAQEVLRGAVK